MPVTIVQLTDCHLGAEWGRDALTSLESVIAQVTELLPAPPDALLVSGDVAHTGAEAQYRQARDALAALDAPLVVIPGNHDDRAALRQVFELPHTGRDDLSCALDLASLRVVALDTQRPGHDGGEFDHDRREWLSQTLAARPDVPTLLAMHHPPLTIGIPALDAIGLPADERRALADVLADHPQVQLIASGHVHRTVAGRLGPTPVLAVPSTNVALALHLEAVEVELVDEPPGFAVHLLLEGALVSHVGCVPEVGGN